MRAAETTFNSLIRGLNFIKRQPRDWKVSATRTSTHRLIYQMVLPYLSIYTRELGATGTQLGLVNSIGMAIAGLVGPPTGWVIDRIGVKTVYMIGILLIAVSYLIYGVAQGWIVIIGAMIAYHLGLATSMQGCQVICGNSLASEDRATGMSCCETLAAGLLGMAGPMIGAWLVTGFGGVSINGIRPLFYIAAVATVGTFVFILYQLSNQRLIGPISGNTGLFSGISTVFKEGKNLKRWLVITSINSLPMGMVIPFSQVFAYEIKGADQFVLGAMVTGAALMPLLLGIPSGRLADRIGRKKVLYFSIPLFWISSLLLIWAPNSGWLIAAGVMQGFFQITAVLTGAMTFELVPPEHMGRWLGIVRLFRMLLAAGTAYLAGAIWDGIGPQYVFLAVIAIDLLVRIPLLIGMPETLNTGQKE
ncbi:MFS transporter [Chloroflexota bacterium]